MPLQVRGGYGTAQSAKMEWGFPCAGKLTLRYSLHSGDQVSHAPELRAWTGCPLSTVLESGSWVARSETAVGVDRVRCWQEMSRGMRGIPQSTPPHCMRAADRLIDGFPLPAVRRCDWGATRLCRDSSCWAGRSERAQKERRQADRLRRLRARCVHNIVAGDVARSTPPLHMLLGLGWD